MTLRISSFGDTLLNSRLFVANATDPTSTKLIRALTLGAATAAASCLLWKFTFNFVLGPVASAVKWIVNSKSRAAICKSMRDERDADLAELESYAKSDADGCPAPTESERKQFAEMSICELRQLMANKKLSPIFLLKCCILNTAAAQRATNCVTCFVPKSHVIERAKLAEKKYTEGNFDFSTEPLLGIPMSIKECIDFENTLSTAGCFNLALQGKRKQSGTIPTTLEFAGAVIFCKTNVPQTMLAYDCANNVFGATANPHNLKFSPGGSSGGEAALLAARGAIVGIGTDIGGSIRIPAHFCGIFGLKPSLWRVPARGNQTSVKGQEAVSGTAGPMGKSISDLKEVFKALVAPFASSIDGTVNFVPFREELYIEYAEKRKRLRIGYFVDDGFLIASPATRRAVLETVAALRKNGHECVEFVPPNIGAVMELFYSFVASDGFDTVSRQFDSAEPPMKAVVLTFLMGRVFPSFFVPHVMANLVSGASQIMANGLQQCFHRTVAQYYASLAQRNDERTKFAVAAFGAQSNFDCVLCPAFVIPAPAIGSTADKSFGVSYTAAFNVLDLSVVTIPVTKVDPEKDAWVSETVPESSMAAGKKVFDLMDKKMKSVYDGQEMAGLPVGVQIVTPRSSEERALGCAQRICEDLNLVCPVPKF